MKTFKTTKNFKSIKALLTSAIFLSAFVGSSNLPVNSMTDLPEETAELTDAPNVPAPITRKTPARVKVDIEVIESIGKLSDNVEYTFWSFGGKVPGKFIRVREGDTVDFTLKNHQNNKVPHNIDLHAVTGPGGGAYASLVAPGKQITFNFKALNPGLYIYHCAAAPVPVHISNGMYGLILVEPKEGLPPVDKEFYVVQGDFYTKGKFGEPGYQEFDLDKGIDEKPTYIVFNGATNSLVDKNALKAKKGEKIRIYFGNGGPNVMSSFHVIGEIFDLVYQEGGTLANQKNVQTTVVPPGGSSMVEFKVDVPGSFVLVDHAIFRAFHKGAVGVLKVEGDPEPEIFNTQKDRPYTSDTKMQTQPTLKTFVPEVKKSVTNTNTKPINFELGRKVFEKNCSVCHLSTGQGVAGVFPPLAKSDYLKNDKNKGVGVILNGLDGKIKVNGVNYQGAMPSHSFLTNQEIAAVANYINSSWGNNNGTVTESFVKSLRKK